MSPEHRHPEDRRPQYFKTETGGHKMRTLKQTEKEKFAAKGIITNIQKEYWVDQDERIVIEEEIVMNYYKKNINEISVMMAEEDCNRISGIRKFNLSDIPGHIKF
jgi:hypothetical protein